MLSHSVRTNIIEQNTPEIFNYEEIYKRYPTDYNESMNTVLIQEVIRYNKLIVLIKENIKNATSHHQR